MLSVEIRTKTGVTAVSADEIAEFSVSEGAPRGIPAGAAVARSFRLRCKNLPCAELDGACLSASYGGVPAGVFYITDCSMSNGGGLMTLTGVDAVGLYLEQGFSDSAGAYPRTAAALLRAVIASAPGMSLADSDFPGAEDVISVPPMWEKGVTLRAVAGHIAFLCGAVARADALGRLEIAALARDAVQVFPDEVSLSCNRFAFGCLRYLFDGDADYTRYAVTGAPDTAANAISARGNPLITRGNIENVVSRLAGVAARGGRLRFYGYLPVRAGDRLRAGDDILLAGRVNTRFTVGGVVTDVISDMPSGGAAGGTGGRTVFTPDGHVNADIIGGLDARILGVDKAYIGSLTADEITANGLISKIIEASGAKIGELSALSAEIVNASVRKLNAGEVSADALTAAFSELVAARIGELSADSVKTDRLAAALAAFTVITAGTARFDRETVRHLISEALDVRDAVGGRVFIENLAADYASLVSADVGSLCVRAADGGYYRLNVDSDGNVTAAPVSLTRPEIERGVTDSGRTIIDTDITAGELNASGVKAARALISRLDASRIGTDALFAGQAFIDSLKTALISASGALRFSLDGAGRAFRGENPPEGAEVNDLWVIPSSGRVYQLTETEPPEGLYAYVDDELNLYCGCAALEEGALYCDSGEYALEIREGEIFARGILWEPVSDSAARALALEALERGGAAEAELSALRRYMQFDDEGLTQRLPGSVYYTVTDHDGFDVKCSLRAEPVATMNAEEGIGCERLTLGGIVCRTTAGGGWVWQERGV